MDYERLVQVVKDEYFHFSDNEAARRMLATLTLTEAARYAGVRRETMREWCFRNLVDYRLSDRVYLIDTASLEKHLLSRKVK